jgi:hypothetical protein
MEKLKRQIEEEIYGEAQKAVRKFMEQLLAERRKHLKRGTTG